MYLFELDKILKAQRLTMNCTAYIFIIVYLLQFIDIRNSA